MGCKYMLTIPSCNFDPAIECPDDLQEAQLSMEASKSYKHVVASFLPSTNEQKGLPPDYKLHCEKMRVSSLVFMLIIGRKTNDDFPRLMPCCTKCIIPDHAGISYANRIFHMRSMSSVWVLCSNSDKLLICQYVC